MEISTAIIGLGTVSQALLTLLEQKRQKLHDQFGIRFRIVCVADSSGAAINDNGFDLLEIVDSKNRGLSARDFASQRSEPSALVALDSIDCQLLFEASPLDLETGGTGLQIVRKSLSTGTHVVLANKGPLVIAFRELQTAARENRASLKYSATVCGGLPVMNIAQRDLVCGEIRRLQGVFNSTSNFILDAMAEGRTYKDALREAQDRGIAESDPDLDVGGWDTAAKLLIMVNTIHGAELTLDDISIEGIENIDRNLIAAESSRGNVIRLVATAERDRFSVRPTALPGDSFLGRCMGWEMAVQMDTDMYGILHLKLWEREPVPTAGSMIRDAIHIFSPGH